MRLVVYIQYSYEIVGQNVKNELFMESIEMSIKILPSFTGNWVFKDH